MIDLRSGIARIGYVLLALWIVGWIALFAWGIVYGHPDWSNWPTILAALVGYPLGIFILWRIVLWIAQGFFRSS